MFGSPAKTSSPAANSRPVAQRAEHRLVVDQRAARGVDHDGPVAAAGRALGVDHLPGLGRRPDSAATGSDTAASRSSGRHGRSRPARARPGAAGGCGSGSPCSKAARAPGQRLADPAHADDAQHRAGESRPSSWVGAQPPQSPVADHRLALQGAPRGTQQISSMAMSAVASVSTSGVLVTVMPRARQLPVDVIGPTEKVAITRTPAGRRSIWAPASFGRAGQDGFCAGAALDQLVGAIATIVGIEQRRELPSQPILDRVGQLARHQHHRLVGGRHLGFQADVIFVLVYPSEPGRATMAVGR